MGSTVRYAINTSVICLLRYVNNIILHADDMDPAASRATDFDVRARRQVADEEQSAAVPGSMAIFPAGASSSRRGRQGGNAGDDQAGWWWRRRRLDRPGFGQRRRGRRRLFYPSSHDANRSLNATNSRSTPGLAFSKTVRMVHQPRARKNGHCDSDPMTRGA